MSYYGWTPDQLELGVKIAEIWYAIMLPSTAVSNEDMNEIAEVENESRNT